MARLEWTGNDITFRYTMVSRAMRDGADRFLFAANEVAPDDGYELGDAVVTRGAKLGRVSDEIAGIQVLEVVLPEPLEEGEAFVAELERTGHAEPGAFTDFQVNTVRAIRVLSVQAVFDEASCPTRMRRSTTKLGRDGSEDVFEADTTLTNGMAQSTLSNIDMGRVRLDWS